MAARGNRSGAVGVELTGARSAGDASGGRRRQAKPGGGGGLGNKVTLMVGQFVNQISGRSGERVDHLTLTTTNGDKVDGGGNGGGPFDETIPTGSFLLGFAGRSGSELDQIQFVFGKPQQASWAPRP